MIEIRANKNKTILIESAWYVEIHIFTELIHMKWIRMVKAISRYDWSNFYDLKFLLQLIFGIIHGIYKSDTTIRNDIEFGRLTFKL